MLLEGLRAFSSDKLFEFGLPSGWQSSANAPFTVRTITFHIYSYDLLSFISRIVLQRGDPAYGEKVARCDHVAHPDTC